MAKTQAQNSIELPPRMTMTIGHPSGRMRLKMRLLHFETQGMYRVTMVV